MSTVIIKDGNNIDKYFKATGAGTIGDPFQFVQAKEGENTISVANSTIALLGAGATFTGAWEDVTAFSTAAVSISGNLAAEPGTLFFDVSHDGVSVHGTIPATVPNNVAFDKPHILNIVEQFIRVRYTNGATPQTVFNLQTKYSNGQQLGILYPISEQVYGTSEGMIVKSVSIAATPTGNYSNMKANGLSFQTVALLGGGATFASGIKSLEGYTQVQGIIISDQDGTFEGKFYADSGGTNLIRTITVPYVGGSGEIILSSLAFGPYVEYKFINGATPQTDFYFDVKFTTSALSGQILGLESFIANNMVANLGRNVIAGKTPSGNYKNIAANDQGQLEVEISDPNTAFGDLRTAELSPLVQLTWPYNINTDLVNITETNGGTVTQADAKAVLQTSTNVAGESVMETIKPIKYRAGLGMLVRYTGMFTTGVADSEQGVGILDDEDGFAFGYDGTDFGILHRSNSSDTWEAQADWNMDTLDGSGNAGNPSGMLLDPTKLNVFETSIQYLGAGEIKFLIEHTLTGRFIPVHTIKYANNFTVPSMYNSTLPLRVYVVNTGNNTNLTVSTASMAGFVEGKEITDGVPQAFENTKSGVNGTEILLFSLRNRATHGGKTNKTEAILKGLSVGNDVNKLSTFRIRKDATVGGVPSFSDINAATSIVQIDTAGTTVSGGKLVWAGTVGKDSGEAYDLEKLDLRIEPGATYSVSTLALGTDNLSAAITWKDDF